MATTIPAGQSISDLVIGSDGELDVYGTANSPTIDDMATLYVDQGGVANNAVIEPGGIEHIHGGADMGATLMSGAIQDIEYQTYDSGIATDTTIDAGALQVVEPYTAAVDAIVYGEQDVYADYSTTAYRGATGSIIMAGGKQEVFAGEVHSTTVSSGGLLDLRAGEAYNTNIMLGGIEHVFQNADDNNATIFGELDDDQSVTSATVESGGRLLVESDGVSRYTTILSGGYESLAGRMVGDVIQGGTEEVLSSGIYEGDFDFSGPGGKLIIDKGALPGSLLQVTGFAPGDIIDLAAFSFSPSSTAVIDPSTGWLEVEQSKTNTYPIVLEPTAAYAGGTYYVSNDGNGGTDVVMEPSLTIAPVEGDNVVTAADFASGGTITISGAAQGAAGQVVTLTALNATEGGAPVALGTATVDASGNWSVAVADTAFQTLVATDTVQAAVPDAVGHAVVATTSVTVAPPTEPVVTLAPVGIDNVLTAADFAAGDTIMITGTAKGAEGKLLALGVLQGSPTADIQTFLQLGTATVASTGAWSVAVPNAALEGLAGLHTLEAVVADAIGNTVSATEDVTIEPPAPVVTGTDVFKAEVAVTSGPLKGDYLWSNPANWESGVAPVNGDSVVIADEDEPAPSVDDLPSLNLGSLTLTGENFTNNQVFVTGASLTVATVSATLAPHYIEGALTGLFADAADSGSPVTVTVGATTGKELYLAEGAGATFIDQSADDGGNTYYAYDGGFVERTTALSGNSGLEYNGTPSTIALETPGTANAAYLYGVNLGDVLELPGTSASPGTITGGGLTLTTNAGAYDFTSFQTADNSFTSGGATYDEGPVSITGYTTAYDPKTGLEAFTFTGPTAVAEDGYIVGGTVRYANGSDNGATATTDARGGFTLTGGTGPLILTGGTDSSTGLSFTGTLEAPNGSMVLTPLTTLVEKVAQAMGDDTSAAGIAAADAAVVTALALPSGTDLTTLDAVAGTLNGVTGAEPVFAAGADLLDTLILVDAAGGSGDAALGAIAGELAAGQTA